MMELINGFLQPETANTVGLVMGAAWLVVSEVLPLIPGVKANGIFHAIYLGLAAILGKETQ